MITSLSLRWLPAAAVVTSPMSTCFRKSASLDCTPAGFSTVAQWPQRSEVADRAPAILSASARATLGGSTASSSPVTQQRRAAMSRRSTALDLGQRLAAAGIALRILAHDRFAHEGDCDRVVLPWSAAESAAAMIWSAMPAMPSPRASLARAASPRASPRPARQARRTGPASAPAPAVRRRSSGRRWCPWNGRRDAPASTPETRTTPSHRLAR